ncbi:malto-oligosyltrehalose synthase [Halomonas sp. McH1-25]|uniref:malto-oligosyltrehalose synthase n=1 Tax=unclassified Halomonas TaxID=2609666 RepID=UPI001EF5F782|nr:MULTISPECIES: malto-oligosyltrehalose synthase [unclassified Halomonas]MCG7600540.1 malto-oligosyltrehalose synthase [Halomonas sp. McH1-25]MCP1362802.1 malto-oligosyltrehalose synthase [Halomonas sp. BBD45]
MKDIRATVRLQFHAGFTLDDASQWVDYFADLGVSHVYGSPLLASRAGSTHGYDGIDPTRIDPEIGGEAALERLVTRLRSRGMGLILDIVPNHVAVGGSENPWWQEVLAWGRDSPYADFFDIDWQSPDPLLKGRLLVPFLGAPYDEVLTSGLLKLGYVPESASFTLEYHEHRFPVDPRRYGDILRHAEHEAMRELAVQFDGLQTRLDAYTGVGELRRRLRHALEDESARAALDQALQRFAGDAPSGAEQLHALIERQNYRLAWWRTASDEINWRRFFDITELGGLRVELPEVFEATHSLILQLVEAGWVDGLRVDHIDGLADPRGYCLRLRERLDALQSKRPADVPDRVALYVEKILAEGEQLHTDWGVDGTTGYEFMNEVSGVQHDPAGAAPLHRLWREVSGREDDFLAEVRQARAEMLDTVLASEFEACGLVLHRVARARRETRDVTLGAVKRALKALVVHFPVYRTYADDNGRPAQDAPFFQQAVAGARGDLNPPDVAVLDRLERWLGGEPPHACQNDDERALRLRAITRFQQLTSPVAAKAVEDTAGYRSAVLISRNDVGFDPQNFCVAPAEFHTASAFRQRHFPHSLVTTATHDHKRGEDVRARLAALSEKGEAFGERVCEWRAQAGSLRREVASGMAPSPGDELILYQVLLGVWSPSLDPDDDDGVRELTERLVQWQQKALREAKLRTHWLWPDEAYEEACRAFLEGLLGEPGRRKAVVAAARELDLPGAINGLAQVTLRMTVPGVPDLYQGTEYWDFSLVDPDNRRPVDYAARRASLTQAEPPVDALAHWRDGHVKQALVHRLLALRGEYPTLFAAGDYQPLHVAGDRGAHVLGFMRQHADQAVLVVVPRLPANLLEGATLPCIPAKSWGDTQLQVTAAMQGEWRDVLSNAALRLREGTIPIRELLSEFPVAVLTWESGDERR